MTATSAAPVGLPPVPTQLGPSALRRRALGTALKAGHCAPTVMKTLVDATGADATPFVKLVAGLPGGIGSTGNECGAATASLVFLGLRHATAPDVDGIPVIISKGRALLKGFQACHGSCACRDLLVLGKLPLRCMGIVRRAPGQCVQVDGRPCDDALPLEERRAYARLRAHLVERDFHCAHAVLRDAHPNGLVDPALLDATSAFVGGTVYAGLTCSALTAGVMLLGLAYGAGEHAPLRILRSMAGMATGGHAFAEDLRAVNGPIEKGHELATWFERAFGSTQCRKLTGVDLATEAGVERFIAFDDVSHCQDVARAVAVHVRSMTGREVPHSRIVAS